MKSRAFVNAMIGMLILTYAFSLIVSTTHLAELYASYDKNAGPVSVGLAVALELSAFLLSITSTALAGLVSKWATGAASFALLLVWFGNGYSMYNSSPDKPLWVTVLLSCFVPVGTFAVGKVLGSLFQVRDILTTEATETPRVQELTDEIQRLKNRLTAQASHEQGNLQRAVQVAVAKEREELTLFTRQIQEAPPLPTPIDHTLLEPDTNRNIELGPLPKLPPTPQQLSTPPERPEATPTDDTQSNQRETMRTLSKLQRDVFVFIKDTGPSHTDQIADDLKKSKINIQKVLEVLVEKQIIVEDNGIFQAII